MSRAMLHIGIEKYHFMSFVLHPGDYRHNMSLVDYHIRGVGKGWSGGGVGRGGGQILYISYIK